MAAFEPLTAAEFKAITCRTEALTKRRLLAISARYDRPAGRVLIQLNNSAVVGFPLVVLPGLDSVVASQLPNRHFRIIDLVSLCG